MAVAFSRGWSLILSITPGTTVLELGDDDGQRARALLKAGARVTCLRPTLEAAEALREAGFEALDWASFNEAESSPVHDAVVVSASLCRTRGSEWLTDDLPQLLAKASASLREGGSLVLALANPLHALPGLNWLRARVLGDEASSREAQGPRVARPMSAVRLRQLLEAAGLRGVKVFAPLPRASRLKFLVPLEEPAALSYFFSHLAPRPRGVLQRFALRLAGQFASWGVLSRLVPEFEAVGVRADIASSSPKHARLETSP